MSSATGGDDEIAADILLVTCVKTKHNHPCAAKDLYVSTQFKKLRACAERLGVPWFILSAEHGLVAPDEWLSPYERYLPDTSAAYQAAWGRWVAARLEMLAGPIAGKTVEVHAGSHYLGVIRPELEALGAVVLEPLRGLGNVERFAWYDSVAHGVDEANEVDDQSFVERLLDASLALAPNDFLAAGRQATDAPGLYSWWADDDGAADISEGLGLCVKPGLIYAGLAGATRWPSGKRSGNTLWLRITAMHLAGNHEFSTFRRTLGAILASAAGATRVDEAGLTEWMHVHLRVVTVPFEDRDRLGKLEGRVLSVLDPPLNLQGMASTPVRKRLRELRKVVTSGG